MAERYKPTSEYISLDDSVSYSDKDLKLAFESFIQEEPKQVSTNLVNFTSVAGFMMIVVSMVYLIGQVFPGSVIDVKNLMQPLPVIGGILATIIGLGWFSRSNKKKKDNKTASNPSFLSGSSSSSSASFSSTSTATANKSTSKSKSEFESAYYDSYALKKSKKLYKSITDKKVNGVCGGLAKYLGVSSTFLRLVFIIATFMGWGSPILLYIGLSIILNKEPRVISENN